MKSYVKIPRGLLTHYRLTASERVVCMYLVCVSGTAKCCYPSYKHIAKELHFSVSTVEKAVKKLCDLNLICSRRRKNAKGGNTSNLYTILQDTYLL